jgi:hypothetical protein
MQLSPKEFWVLDATVHWNYQLPLAFLNHPEANEIFNKLHHHNLTTDQLIDLLDFMQKQGDLAIYRGRTELFGELLDEEPLPERAPQVRTVIDYTPIWESPVFYPKAAIVEDFSYCRPEEMIGKPDPKKIESLYFCATRQGAEKWEQTAQVDWNKYFDYEGIWIEDADLAENQDIMYCRAAARSERVLDAYFEWETRWGAHPDSFKTSCFRRYHTERIAPWKATYWKMFPEGFECDFVEYTVWRTDEDRDKNKIEPDRHTMFYEQSSNERNALFDWCNAYVKDFPFPDD